MISASKVKIGTTVSFDLYPAQIFGTTIKNAKVVALVSAAIAIRLGFDAPAWHASVLPTIPDNQLYSSYDKYDYVCLKLSSGQTTYVGLPWINETTYEESTTRSIALTIENITPDQQNLAVQALSAIGLRVAKVEEL